MAAAGVFASAARSSDFSSSHQYLLPTDTAPPAAQDASFNAIAVPRSKSRSKRSSAEHNAARSSLDAASQTNTLPRNALLRSQLKSIDTSMAATDGKPSTSTGASDTRRAKLHKRSGSGGSPMPVPPSPYTTGIQSQFATPYATYEDQPLPDRAHSPAPTSSTPKINQYLRKMSSSSKDSGSEQGRLDLSKSLHDNNAALAGLGIDDLTSTRSASDVSFARATRRVPHTRTVSGNSQASGSSAATRAANQPFIHPMRQTPRPYTPPGGRSSYASTPSLDSTAPADTHAAETTDILATDFHFPSYHRSHRSTSHPTQPTRPHDLGHIPKLTSSLPTHHTPADLHPTHTTTITTTRPRKSTDLSFPANNTPSTRTSLDRALSLVPSSLRTTSADITPTIAESHPAHHYTDDRPPHIQPQTRDELIRAARAKFDAKEAEKARRAERRGLGKRGSVDRVCGGEEGGRRRSEGWFGGSFDGASRASGSFGPISGRRSETFAAAGGGRGEEGGAGGAGASAGAGAGDEKSRARGHASWPGRKSTTGSLGASSAAQEREKERPRVEYAESETPRRGAWTKFEVWARTTLLSCGEKG